MEAGGINKLKVMLTGANPTILNDILIHISERFSVKKYLTDEYNILEIVMEQEPDVIVINLSDAENTYRLFYDKIFEYSHIDSTKVIFVTKNKENPYLKKYRHLTNVSVIERPIDMERLIEEIEASRSLIGSIDLDFDEDSIFADLNNTLKELDIPVDQDEVSEDSEQQHNNKSEHSGSDEHVNKKVNTSMGKEQEQSHEFAVHSNELEQVGSDIADLQNVLTNYETTNRKCILVIDDDKDVLYTINQYLKEYFDVITVDSGKKAYKILEKKKVDLILLDYIMPKENGMVVFSNLQDSEITRDIPVMFLTGVDNAEKVKRILVMKPKGYILKPVKKSELLSKIVAVVEEEYED